MEGVTRRVLVTADVAIGSDTIRATGTFVAKQTDFGIRPFGGGPGGTVKVADRVTFCFDLVGVRRLPSSPVQEAAGQYVDATGVPGCIDNSKTEAEPAQRPM